MQLLPHSLLWRAFLLIATLMLLAVAAWLAIFQEAELDRRSRQLAQMVASITNLTRAALLAAHPDHRRELLVELSDREGVRVYPADAGDAIVTPPARELTRRIEARLREQLGPETRLAFGLNGEPGLFIHFRIFEGEGGNFWLALPRERLDRYFSWQWLGWGTAVLLLSLAGAWLIVYRIVRPLEEERALLLAGISHDLRTPLTRLRMETELSVADPEARAGMEADIVEMDRTIGQFLDFARPADAAHRATLDLVPLLDEIATRYAGRIISHRPANADFRVAARADTLRRAIVNLIENALRHADAPVELDLAVSGRYVEIAVLDRGPGIPPAAVERLKQPFTRGEAARTGAGGAGLGLAIVERIVRAQGGRLELRPRAGGGLAARIRLKKIS